MEQETIGHLLSRMTKITAELAEYKLYHEMISGLGSCNNCGSKENCEMAPVDGGIVRINCFHWTEGKREPKYGIFTQLMESISNEKQEGVT